MRLVTLLCLALPALRVASGCRTQPSTVLQEHPQAILARLQQSGHASDASLGDGAVRYLGFEVLPEGAFPGDEITLIHYWVATRPIEASYRVFVHFLLQGARGWIPHADHDPIPDTRRWPPGSVIRDEHRVTLPDSLPANVVELRLGLYRTNQRMAVAGDRNDGSDRVRAGTFAVSGSGAPLPVYRAKRLATPPILDGSIDPAEWGGATAEGIDGFTLSHGRAPSALRTRVVLAWDPTHLYLAFDCEDPDIIASFGERDDPVFREEVVEIFIDPTGERRDYVELQVSPKGTQFDAAFTGGPRRNMETKYDARYRVAVAVDGTIEAPTGAPADRDRGWRSEWAIEAESIRGLKTPLAAGAKMRINLFRIAKDRVGEEIVSDESAWVAPLMGDFHNLDRFGELWLVP